MNTRTCPLPVIDLAPLRAQPEDPLELARLANEVDEACRSIGFLVLANHGISDALLRQTFDAATAFFDAPDAVRRSAMPADTRVRGYTPMQAQRLARSLNTETPPDLFERFRMGPFAHPDDDYHRSRAQGWFAPNVWPSGLAGFREAMQTYYGRMAALSAELMQLFARALGLPPQHFDPYIDRHISSLCLNHYPALTAEPEPGQLRAGAHTDYGSLTIVAPTQAPGRLEILARNGEWVEVDPPPGHFVVNIGDLMAQWTHDRWVSTLHRVGTPPVGGGASSRRLSLVFFHQPNDDARIECLPTCAPEDGPVRYAPTTSGEHLRMKLTRHLTAPAGN